MPFFAGVRRIILAAARRIIWATSGTGEWDFSDGDNCHHVLTAGF